MHAAHRLFACVVLAVVACPGSTAAQSANATPLAETLPGSQLPLPNDRIEDAGFWTWFRAVPGDFHRLLSWRTTRIVGVGGAAALGAHQWDEDAIAVSQEQLRPALFRPGNTGGGFLTQVGAGVAVYSIARWARAEALASAGSDLIRAHLLSQGVVQGGKLATRRTRPDGSDNRSLPSGHTAAAFTTATVLEDRFGWRFGIPAYAFGTYVAASRMAANKHHLSDVVLGAAVGIAAGRTVSIRSNAGRFELGVAPVPGGAAITLTAARPSD